MSNLSTDEFKVDDNDCKFNTADPKLDEYPVDGIYVDIDDCKLFIAVDISGSVVVDL